MKKIIVLVSNDLSYDQRVAKTCTWWHEKGYKVNVVGFAKRDSRTVVFPYKHHRFSNPFQRGVWFYSWIQLRLFFYLLLDRADVVWSNDLDTLWPAVSLKKWKKWKVLYDAHECFTESVGLIGHPYKRKIWMSIEKSCMPKVDHCFTVSSGIQEFYRDKYSKIFHVIRNMPDLSVAPISIEKPKSWLGKHILFYHGVFNPHRGLDELIEAMPLIPECLLVLVGFGEHESVLRDKVSSLNLEGEVLFLGAMNYPNILGMLEHAHMGIALEKPVSESFKWALPNKIFDYARMNLPFITLGNPEVKEILEKYPMGWMVPTLDSRELSSSILHLLSEIPKTKESFAMARKSFFSENNSKKEWRILETIAE